MYVVNPRMKRLRLLLDIIKTDKRPNKVQKNVRTASKRNSKGKA